MTKNTDHIVQIIEHIGGPLLSAISAVSATKPVEDGDAFIKADAQKIAELLARSVRMSIDLGKMVEIEKVSAEQAEPLRVALASIAGPMVANYYKSSGRTPSENDLQRIITALEAVMAFSDNFTPSDEAAARLTMLEAQGTAVDSHQANIQYLNAFTPIVDAIAAFSFGQQEKALMLDISNKITQKAKVLRTETYGDTFADADQKRIELGLVKALADLFALCYSAAVVKFSALADPDATSQTQAISGIWSDFEKRASLLHALTGHLSPHGSTRAAQGGSGGQAPETMQPAQAPMAAPAAPVTPAAPPVQPQPQQAAPPPVQEPPPQAAPPTAPPPVEQSQQSGDAQQNPMSMFAAPKQDAAPPPPPPQAPMAPPIAAEPAVEQQAPAPVTPPPAQTPPVHQEQPQAQQPAQAPPASGMPTAPINTDPPAAGENPMSMFAAPKQDGQPPQPSHTGVPPVVPSIPPEEPPPPPPESNIFPPAGREATQDAAQTDNAGGEQDSGGAGPMSFFKKSDDD